MAFYRLFNLFALLLLLENFGTLGQSTNIPATAVEVAPSSPAPNPADNTQARFDSMTPVQAPASSAPKPADNTQARFDQMTSLQSPYSLFMLSTIGNKGTWASTRLSPLTSIPTMADSTFPAQSSMPSRPFTPPKTTLPSAFSTVTPGLMLTTVPLTQAPTFASTDLPNNNPITMTPQRCQITFGNMYKDLQVTDYDKYFRELDIRSLMAGACKIDVNRITGVSIQSNSSGFLVARFSIEPGYPDITEVLENLKTRLNKDPFLLGNQILVGPIAVFWTDNGTCPHASCTNGGQCVVSVDGEFTCSCSIGFTGSQCQDEQRLEKRTNSSLFALLVLLVIPVAVALIVGFVFGMRKQQKAQLKKTFDLRDVRTIGPKSMLSLPQEPGMRNQMYDTRSFAMAFTDNTFSKATASSTEDGSSVVY